MLKINYCIFAVSKINNNIKNYRTMKSIKLLSITVLLFGFTFVGTSQTFQEITDALNRGREMMATGDFEAAILELEKSIELSEQMGEEALEFQSTAERALPSLYLQKAIKISATGDFPATLRILESTIAAAEKVDNVDIKESAQKIIPQTYFAIGAAAYNDKNYEEAINNLNQAVSLDPTFARPYEILGIIYQVLKDEEQMIKNYKLAVEVGEANNNIATARAAKTRWFNYYNAPGSQAFNSQKWDDAISLLSKAIEIDDTNYNAIYALTASFNNKRSWDSAILHGEKALELRSGGDTNDIYYQLGVAYAGKKNNAKACESFRNVTSGRFLDRAKFEIEHTLKCK